jgi:hypothetical protein
VNALLKSFAIAALSIATLTPASTQSALYNIVDGNQVCVWVGSPPTMHCSALSPKVSENIARAKAARECRAYGSCGQQRPR